MIKLDAHIHYNGNHPDCVELLERLDLKLINVCVAHTAGEEWRERAQDYQQLAHTYPDHYAWCTTFDPPDFGPDYAERVIAGLKEDFATGAVGCKIWKNVGMQIKKPSGEFLLVDDPLFDPIYSYLIQAGQTVLMHIGEPKACWEPLDENNTHYGYYSQHSEWYMYDKPEYPSHQDLIDARDRVLARYPKLWVVGAHLGSLEYDVSEIARRLDRYPNFAVDTSARTRDLALQDRDTVRQFFERYQDRILFGTDFVTRSSQADLETTERFANVQRLNQVYQREFAYYDTLDELSVAGRTVQGLGLSSKTLERFYHDNAVHWYGEGRLDR
jgi:predicted TIM-barrel fold metal-dependent hydrolase